MSIKEKTVKYVKDNKFKSFLIVGGSAVTLLNPSFVIALGAYLASSYIASNVTKDILELDKTAGYKKESFLMIGGIAFAAFTGAEFTSISHYVASVAFGAGAISMVNKMEDKKIEETNLKSKIESIREKLFETPKTGNKFDV